MVQSNSLLIVEWNICYVSWLNHFSMKPKYLDLQSRISQEEETKVFLITMKMTGRNIYFCHLTSDTMNSAEYVLDIPGPSFTHINTHICRCIYTYAYIGHKLYRLYIQYIWWFENNSHRLKGSSTIRRYDLDIIGRSMSSALDFEVLEAQVRLTVSHSSCCLTIQM